MADTEPNLFVPERFEKFVLDSENAGVTDKDAVIITIKSVRDKGVFPLRISFAEFKDFVTYGRTG